jgi:hypothetical protein
MSDPFEADAMEDPFDEAEGPSEFDAFEDDAFEEDPAEEDPFIGDVVGGLLGAEEDPGEEDPFLGDVVGGLLGAEEDPGEEDPFIGDVVGGLLGAEEDPGDLGDEDLGDPGEPGDLGLDPGDTLDTFDAIDNAVADALESEDADEFLGNVIKIARQVGRGVGKAARFVAPLAKAIPLPQAQAIGQIADVAGRLLADGADEFEAFDDLVDLAEEEDNIDAAAPVAAGLAVRKLMPAVARLPRQQRRQIVKSVSRAIRTVAHRHGPRAARAVPKVLKAVQRAVRQHRIPGRALPRAVHRAALRLAHRPRTLRRLAGPVAAMARGRRLATGGPRRRWMDGYGGRWMPGGVARRRGMGGYAGRWMPGGIARRRKMGGYGGRWMPGGIARRRAIGGYGGRGLPGGIARRRAMGGMGYPGYGARGRRAWLRGPVEIIIRSR